MRIPSFAAAAAVLATGALVTVALAAPATAVGWEDSSTPAAVQADEEAGQPDQAATVDPGSTEVAYALFDESTVAVPGKGKGTSVAAALPSGCKEITGTVTTYNVLNQKLYSFKQTSSWCYTGGSVTSKASYMTVDVFYTGWGYKGLVDQANAGNNPWVRYRQVQFAQCAPTPWGEACARRDYPWIRQNMFGNGAYSQSYGGV